MSLASVIITLRQRLARVCIRAASWLDSDAALVSVPRDELYWRARQLTGLIESVRGQTSGEYKRHQVLAQLMDEFPTTSKRQLAQIIEVVL